MGMYEDVVSGVSETVKIMGMPFFAENIQADEPYNRRERNFTSILGGTERSSKGKYIHRSFTFTTTIFFPTGKPDVYNSIFQKMMSEAVEVSSPYMGKFNAFVHISINFPEHSPNHMEVDFTIDEATGNESTIPGENFVAPASKKVTPKTETSKKDSKSKKTKSDKTKSKKNKSKKNSQKKKNK